MPAFWGELVTYGFVVGRLIDEFGVQEKVLKGALVGGPPGVQGVRYLERVVEGETLRVVIQRIAFYERRGAHARKAWVERNPVFTGSLCTNQRSL